MREHFQFIMDALDHGLDMMTERAECPFKSVTDDFPTLIEGLHPPRQVRAVVVIDDQPYEVYIKAAEPGEAHEPEAVER